MLFLTGTLLIAGVATIGTHYASSTNDLLTANVEALSWGESGSGPCGDPSYAYDSIWDRNEGTSTTTAKCTKDGELVVFGQSYFYGSRYKKGVSYTVVYETASCQSAPFSGSCCNSSASSYHILTIDGYRV